MSLGITIAPMDSNISTGLCIVNHDITFHGMKYCNEYRNKLIRQRDFLCHAIYLLSYVIYIVFYTSYIFCYTIYILCYGIYVMLCINPLPLHILYTFVGIALLERCPHGYGRELGLNESVFTVIKYTVFARNISLSIIKYCCIIL